MTETVVYTAPLARWEGGKAVYHMLQIKGETAEAIAMHARLRKLELGGHRGFGQVKVLARIGEAEWKTSLFPQDRQTSWTLLISKKLMRAEDLSPGDPVEVTLELI